MLSPASPPSTLLPSTGDLSGQNLGGLVLTPGVYTYSSSAELSGNQLTFDFQDLNGATIVLQIGSTLTTASGSSVVAENLGTDDNVYYAVGSSATLGTNSSFLGDIIAQDSVALTTGANITCGSAIALTGAVTLDTNTITNCSANGSDVSSTVSSITGDPTIQIHRPHSHPRARRLCPALDGSTRRCRILAPQIVCLKSP